MWKFIQRLLFRRAQRPDVAPPVVLSQALAHTRFDPNATRFAELFSGGFWYSDEMPESWDIDGHSVGDSFRFLTAYRASLVRDKPDERFRSLWEETQRLCPQWPGFLPERSERSLHAELEKELRANCRTSLRALHQFEKNRRRESK